MIRLLIADDEKLEREALAELVQRRFEREVVLEMAENGRKAADTAVLWNADLILMDIEMPGMSGLDAARAVLAQRPSCRVIFVTAYSLFQYAHEAVHLGACDYLLKPVDEGRLAAALDWDWQRRQDRKKRPVLRVGGRTVPLDEIAYLETAGRKTAVHTREERIEYTVPLSKLKEEFQKQGFCLSHFSYLVNLAHVARVERDALTLDTGEAIPVSRRYYQDFMARYVESLK